MVMNGDVRNVGKMASSTGVWLLNTMTDGLNSDVTKSKLSVILANEQMMKNYIRQPMITDCVRQPAGIIPERPLPKTAVPKTVVSRSIVEFDGMDSYFY